MKFSTRTTYGLRAMIRLAQNWDKGTLSLSNIAKKENISLRYLEHLFANLKKERLVISEKGMAGGYKLSKDPKKTKVFNIVKTLEGKISPFHCLDDSGKIYCDDKCKCGATLVLIKVQDAVNKTLKSISLKDLL